MKFEISLSVTVFTLGIVLSLVINSEYNTYSQNYVQNFDLEYKAKNMLFFMDNNTKVIILLLSGAIFFAVTTFATLLYNGMYISSVIIGNVQKGMHIEDLAALLLPHGILEIPAIIIAGAAGFKIPYEIVRYLLGRKDVVLTKQDIREYLTLAAISIVLIVIAAWIEANVTLKIAEAMLNSTKGI